MHNFDDENDNATESVLEAAHAEAPAEALAGAEETTESAENAAPFDENELLTLAQNEGLADLGSADDSESEETETSAKVELSEEDQALLMASMETVLFMSDKPVSLPKLRSVINPEVSISVYRALMAKLREEFARDYRGIEIAEVSLGFQLRTKPHMASILRKMVKTQPLKLSTSNMEVLAITAYKQPVTKDEIDSIRGVDSGYVLRNLMEKRLVRIVGRSDLPGKPMVYGTTHEFLELFSLKDLKGMPALHEVESMVAASEIGAEEKMQTVMTEFGKLMAGNTKVLFDDSQVDEELEALRAEIASIPTSTAFIDEQKNKEKLQLRLNELAEQGLTLDLDGNEVPIGTAPAMTAEELIAARAQRRAAEEAQLEAETEGTETQLESEVGATEMPALESDSAQASEIAEESAPVDHQPSAELQADAEAAQWERHAAMIAEAVAESQLEVQIASTNVEALLQDAQDRPEAAPEVIIDSDPENEHKREPDQSL